MSLFEFNCAQCQHHFEQVLEADGKQTLCPRCGAEVLAKQLADFDSEISNPALRKGMNRFCATCLENKE